MMRSVDLSFPVFDEVLLTDVPIDAVRSCHDVVENFVILREGGLRAVCGFFPAIHYTISCLELKVVIFRSKDVLGVHKEDSKLVSFLALEVE